MRAVARPRMVAMGCYLDIVNRFDATARRPVDGLKKGPKSEFSLPGGAEACFPEKFEGDELAIKLARSF